MKVKNAFIYNMSTDVKVNKTKKFKKFYSEQFLGALLNELAYPIMKIGVPLTKNVLTPLM